MRAERADLVAVAAQLVRERRVAAVCPAIRCRARRGPAQKQMRSGSSLVTVSSADTNAASPRQARSAGLGLAVGVQLRLDQVLPGHDLRARARREHDRALPHLVGADAVAPARRLGALRIAIGIDELGAEIARPRRARRARPARAAGR